VPEVRLSVDEGNSENPLAAASFWSMNDLSSTVRKVYDNIQVQVDCNLVGDIKRFLKDWHLLHDITNPGGADLSKPKSSNLESADLDSIKLQLSDSVNLMEALVVSAFSILAKHISGHDKFIMGLEHSVRSHDSMKGIMLGPLVSTLPFKINCEREMTFQDVFEYVVHSMRVMAHHRYYGLGWINEHIVKNSLISGKTRHNV
jgi:hypothetical protein